MSILLAHELYDARDRILLLKQRLEAAREKELPEFRNYLTQQLSLLDEALLKARIPDYYRVGIVGRFKVGKSSFVNRLANYRLAGVNTSPETAAISVFRYGTEPRAEVELISREEWDRLAEEHAEDPKNPEVKRYDLFKTFNERVVKKDSGGQRRERFDLDDIEKKWISSQSQIHKIGGGDWQKREEQKDFLAAIKEFTSSQKPLHYLVNKLVIYAPIPLLRDQIELIDTPGLDDTERYRVLLTDELVKEVDAILFLTESGASYGQSDKEFLIRELRRKQIKHLQIVVTKCDVTYANSCNDAEQNDDPIPTYAQFKAAELARVRAEISCTLNELLESNQLSDEEGMYYIEQLDAVPVHLISAKYHDENKREDGGIDGVLDTLYETLATSKRFEDAKRILQEQLQTMVVRLRDRFRERLNTLETDYDPQLVQEELEEIRDLLHNRFEEFGQKLGEEIGLLKGEQEAFFQILPVYLDNIEFSAREVLDELQRNDLTRHWRTRRNGGWGYLNDLQGRVADRIFPRVEMLLNQLTGKLSGFMEQAKLISNSLQGDVVAIERKRDIGSTESLNLADAVTPHFATLIADFESLAEIERNAIVAKLDSFVDDVVIERLVSARERVSEVVGKGTTIWQNSEVSDFYATIKRLLAEAVRTHVQARLLEFAAAILQNCTSVAPRVQRALEEIIEQRIEAIDSALRIATQGQKEQVQDYLSNMIAILTAFPTDASSGAQSIAYTLNPDIRATAAAQQTDDVEAASPEPLPEPAVKDDASERHYEIADGEVGYTYERIFRPYIDDAEQIRLEEPYVLRNHQVDNVSRFCALAVRLGRVRAIELVSAKSGLESSDEADSRLESLRRDLASRGITFTVKRIAGLHDREVSFDNGWVVKVGRGLDFYQKPQDWVSVEAADFSLRRCAQTKIDVFRRDWKEVLGQSSAD
jgi:GTPase SAR1 family protein